MNDVKSIATKFKMTGKQYIQIIYRQRWTVTYSAISSKVNMRVTSYSAGVSEVIHFVIWYQHSVVF